jgi:hypothetical protein
MNICVYGASSTTIDKTYIEAGEALGEEMAKRNIGLVFGGGANGLMGAVARGENRFNGKIIGIAPKFFNVDGILFENCTEFIYPQNMRERKMKMEELSDAFIITPGGIGTFDEFFEILTLKQLNRHNKPIAILNTNGYYNSLEAFIQNGIDNNFMNKECKKLYFISDSPAALLDYIENYNPSDTPVSKFKDIK